MNPWDLILWGYLKEFVYKPLHANLQERVTREFSNLSKAVVAKAVFGMKKRSLNLLKKGGEEDMAVIRK